MIYGYCRISRKTQNIERQERNILKEYPTAHIIKEAYTGTKINRKEFNKLLKAVKQGDTIVFDSVSRMSRNANEGFKLYKDLYNNGINLVFLKERHIDTQSFEKAKANISVLKNVETGNKSSDKLVNSIMEAVTEFMMSKLEDDIMKAFEQAEKEVTDLQQRTKEGIVTAKLNGKQIGIKKGQKLNIKGKDEKKDQIKKYSRDFNGTLSDKDVMKLVGLARNTYYKYKREIAEEMLTSDEIRGQQTFEV